MAKPPRYPVFDARTDGNPFEWILVTVNDMRRHNSAKAGWTIQKARESAWKPFKGKMRAANDEVSQIGETTDPES